MKKSTIDFTDEKQVKQYLTAITKQKDPQRWKYYDESVKHAKEMAVHANGEKPYDILNDTRPNEPKEIKEYRIKVFQAITKSKFKKIINVCQRINNGKNYFISFPDDVSVIIKNDKTDFSLQSYIEKQYPYYGNLVQYIFDVCLKQMFVDPNSVLAFNPLPNDDDTMPPQIIGKIFESKNVIDKQVDEYYTFLLDEKSIVSVGNSNKADGNIYHVYTRNEIIEFRQVGKKTDNTYTIEVIYTHGIGEVPVVVLGGEYVTNTFPFLYESYVSGILPFWNKALRLDMDIDANYIQHLYLERVEIQVECDNIECGKNGADVGYVCSGEKKYTQCNRCHGSGFISGRSPYGVTTVKKENISGAELEFPGVQYIDKPTGIVEIAERKLQSLIDQGFEAINMDILKSVGENQSGIAKTIDRTDMDSFLMSISNNIFDNIIYYSIYYINKLRYSTTLGKAVDKQMPTINKPTHFDVISSQQLVQELAASSTVPNQLKDALLIEIINKKYPNDLFAREYNKALIELDPLRGKTVDEKMAEFANGWIEREDLVVSSNLSKFILNAYEKDKEFFNLNRNDKLNILYSFVEEEAEEKEIELFDNNGNGNDNQGGGQS